jgi:hypothetical protein
MALFTAQLDPQLSQGDLFRPDWDDDRDLVVGSVIVISWGSEIDKSDTILVADTTADGETEQGLLASIRGGKVWHGLYLPEVGRWINLRTIRPLAKVPFIERLDQRSRSMTPEGRAAIAGAVFAFLTRRSPPRKKYFRDEQGVIWDAWEVRRKDIESFQGKFPQRVGAALANGWLGLTSAAESRRLAPCPFGWQYLRDPETIALLQQAAAIDAADLAAAAIDQIVRATPEQQP